MIDTPTPPAEIQCPRCGKIIRLKGDADTAFTKPELRDAVKRGERPAFLCLQCFLETEPDEGDPISI